ncbi:5-hydroxytryptamine receptor 3A-like [Nelusetta ayraudi]|uniref:5-hydroxytryptamine receptor 3A-like n=1 Tax=Nelusetta ayraudi TaxID=303726 RepID=UPI003F72D4FB
MQPKMSRLGICTVSLILLTAGCIQGELPCRSRRCLAEMLIKKELFSQPQYEKCTQKIKVPFMEYQTLSVDTKNLRLNSRLQASLIWRDLDLAWNTSEYRYDEVVLPVNKIWTPELHVTNGIQTTMKHSSRDLLVDSNGTVRHNVIISAAVNCEVNLFNYPFAADECPVAIQTWTNDGCGTELELGNVRMVDGSHGDWRTVSVSWQTQSSDRNYIWVSLSIKFLNPFITLMLPSILIVLADIISFALPLGGGERNSFKVTLVLSFTMFLLILNNVLPGDSQCNPIIRTHFCICLIFLVASMLLSMIVTRMAKEGGIMFCCCTKVTEFQAETVDEVSTDAKVDISSHEQIEMLQKVVKFLEDMNAKDAENEKHYQFANKVDKIIAWFYLVIGTVYFICMITVMVKYKCVINHFDFWY